MRHRDVELHLCTINSKFGAGDVNVLIQLHVARSYIQAFLNRRNQTNSAISRLSFRV